jgi:hypothetical protein
LRHSKKNDASAPIRYVRLLCEIGETARRTSPKPQMKTARGELMEKIDPALLRLISGAPELRRIG